MIPFQLDTLYGFFLNPNCIFDDISYYLLFNYLYLCYILSYLHTKNIKLKLNKCSFIWNATSSALQVVTI